MQEFNPETVSFKEKKLEMNRIYNKREIITDTTFDFTKQRVQYQIQYQGNGKATYKRFDRSTQGLCLFIYPSGVKVFCAIKKFSM